MPLYRIVSSILGSSNGATETIDINLLNIQALIKQARLTAVLGVKDAIIAGGRGSRVVASDATTGKHLYEIEAHFEERWL